MPAKKKTDPESVVREIKRKTRRKYSAEEKIRIVLEGLRGEETIAELCRREGINPNLYYTWSKEFLEAGKARYSISPAGARRAWRRGRRGSPAAARSVPERGHRSRGRPAAAARPPAPTPRW